MDACDPGIDIKNLRKLIKTEVGEDLNLSRNQICEVYSGIQDGKLPLPPLILTSDRNYLIDSRSPLTQNDYEILFNSSSKVASITRIARKVGLKSKNLNKQQLKDAIGRRLSYKNIREPIKLRNIQKRRIDKYISNSNKTNETNNNITNALNIKRPETRMSNNDNIETPNSPKTPIYNNNNNNNNSKNGGNLESAIRQYKRHRPIKLPNFLSQPRRRERDSSGYRSPGSILTKKYPNGSEWRQVSSGRRNYPTSSKGGQSFSNIGSTLSSVGRQRTRNWVKTQKPILKTPSPPGSGSSTTQTYRGKNGSGNSKVTFKEPFTPPSGSSSIIPPSGTGVSTVQQVAAEAAAELQAATNKTKEQQIQTLVKFIRNRKGLKNNSETDYIIQRFKNGDITFKQATLELSNFAIERYIREIKKNKKFKNVNFDNKEIMRILQINGLSEVKKELFSYQKQKGDTKFELLKRQIQKYMMNIKNNIPNRFNDNIFFRKLLAGRYGQDFESVKYRLEQKIKKIKKENSEKQSSQNTKNRRKRLLNYTKTKKLQINNRVIGVINRKNLSEDNAKLEINKITQEKNDKRATEVATLEQMKINLKINAVPEATNVIGKFKNNKMGYEKSKGLLKKIGNRESDKIKNISKMGRMLNQLKNERSSLNLNRDSESNKYIQQYENLKINYNKAVKYLRQRRQNIDKNSVYKRRQDMVKKAKQFGISPRNKEVVDILNTLNKRKLGENVQNLEQAIFNISEQRKSEKSEKNEIRKKEIEEQKLANIKKNTEYKNLLTYARNKNLQKHKIKNVLKKFQRNQIVFNNGKNEINNIWNKKEDDKKILQDEISKLGIGSNVETNKIKDQLSSNKINIEKAVSLLNKMVKDRKSRAEKFKIKRSNEFLKEKENKYNKSTTNAAKAKINAAKAKASEENAKKKAKNAKERSDFINEMLNSNISDEAKKRLSVKVKRGDDMNSLRRSFEKFKTKVTFEETKRKRDNNQNNNIVPKKIIKGPVNTKPNKIEEPNNNVSDKKRKQLALPKPERGTKRKGGDNQNNNTVPKKIIKGPVNTKPNKIEEPNNNVSNKKGKQLALPKPERGTKRKRDDNQKQMRERRKELNAIKYKNIREQSKKRKEEMIQKRKNEITKSNRDPRLNKIYINKKKQEEEKKRKEEEKKRKEEEKKRKEEEKKREYQKRKNKQTALQNLKSKLKNKPSQISVKNIEKQSKENAEKAKAAKNKVVEERKRREREKRKEAEKKQQEEEKRKQRKELNAIKFKKVRENAEKRAKIKQEELNARKSKIALSKLSGERDPRLNKSENKQLERLKQRLRKFVTFGYIGGRREEFIQRAKREGVMSVHRNLDLRLGLQKQVERSKFTNRNKKDLLNDIHDPKYTIRDLQSKIRSVKPIPPKRPIQNMSLRPSRSSRSSRPKRIRRR
tara:strand:- start:1477 stop:5727 length:4251 start_codon:yes stop_codon:yes gene_type:complete